MKSLVRIEQFAEIAGIAVATARSYRHFGSYGFPPPDHKVGPVLLWKRTTAKAWSKRQRKRSAS